MLTPILPNPGVYREGTQYIAEGRWFDSNLIRWRKGLPEEVGGWSQLLAGAYLGAARKLHDWSTIIGSNYIGVGTTYKLYVHDGAAHNDITPLAYDAVDLATDPITTANGSNIITIAITGHACVIGDFLTISGATGFNGISAGALNTEHRVVGTPDANNVEVAISEAATGSGTGGGASVVAEVQINIGLDVYVSGSGWGSGSWGSGSWGGGTSLSPANQLRLWSLDNFGDDLLACVRTGGVYYWDESVGVATRAQAISTLPRRSLTLSADPIITTNGTAVLTIRDEGGHGIPPLATGDIVTISGASGVSGIPASEINTEHTVTAVLTDELFQITVTTVAGSSISGGGASVAIVYDAGAYATPVAGLQVMTSPTARHVVVFGANDFGETTTDQLMVRWCSSEAPTDWWPTDENSAGFQRLSAGSTFIGALRTRQEILIWTDAGLVSMRYVGLPLVFTFTEIESGVGLISPNAAVNAGGVVWFMDRGGFFAYDGSVRRVPCDVRDYVFQDLDLSNAYKIHAGSNIDFSEVAWFYPSASGNGEVDRYVKYNYDENLWDFGTLDRGAWINAFTRNEPVASTLNRQVLGQAPVLAQSGSPTLTITAAAHGLSAGSQVILSNIGSVASIDVRSINTLHTVATIVDADTFTITLPFNAGATEQGGGGSGILIAEDILVSHEVGHDALGSPMPSYIESGDVDIEDGHHFWFMVRMLPDMSFRGTPDPETGVRMKLMVRDYPAEGQRTAVDELILPSTEQSFIRMRARQLAFRIEKASDGLGYGWRLGKTRFEVRQDGRR